MGPIPLVIKKPFEPLRLRVQFLDDFLEKNVDSLPKLFRVFGSKYLHKFGGKLRP